MQIKVIAKRADLNRHREIVQREMAQETDENCRLLQQDYLTLIDRIGAREATSRRFFMVFEYEAWAGRKRDNEEAESHCLPANGSPHRSQLSQSNAAMRC